MSGQFYKWSQTAASNATADNTVGWAEGQAPSSVNDSARAMMASVASYRDDIAGAIATGGTSTAYTVTSYQVFDTLAHLNGQMIAFTPHATNNGTTTLNVDGLGAKPLRQSPSVELVAGHLIQGTPYVAVYNNSDAAFYLQGFFGNPYNVPIGSSIDYWGATAPNSSFVLAYGQAISRTTYATLFSLLSTTFGSGDGSTTFNIPDCRGRVIAGKDDMGGSAASRLSSAVSGTVLGAVGGGESVTLAANQIPTLTSSGSNSISVDAPGFFPHIVSAGWLGGSAGSGANQTYAYTGGAALTVSSGKTSTGSNSISVSYTNGSQAVTQLVQPTIIANKVLRII